jgi:hypothetical protein
MINFLLFPILVLVAIPDYSDHPNMKAMFMKGWQCNQVKTDKEKCIVIDNYVGLFEEEEEEE